ncbi:response regulator [Myxococcota bacterium]
MSSSDGARQFSVLVVDDEQMSVETVLRMLRGRYHAVGATSVREALELCDQQVFDVAIVDQRLRDGTGTSLLAQLAEKWPLMRRIAFSGSAEMGDLLAAINVAKVARFLLKPIDRGEILQALEDAINEYDRERQAMTRILLAKFGQEEAKRGRVEQAEKDPTRSRPPSWPPERTICKLDREDPSALTVLLKRDLEVSIAAVSPSKELDENGKLMWRAELERRLVTSLRETDQAFRMENGVFVVAFSHTSRGGAHGACARLTNELRGGAKVQVSLWPSDFPDPGACAKRVLRS